MSSDAADGLAGLHLGSGVPAGEEPEECSCSTPLPKPKTRAAYHRVKSLEFTDGLQESDGPGSPLPPSTPGGQVRARRSSAVMGTPTSSGFGDRSSGGVRSTRAARELLASIAGLGPEATRRLLLLPRTTPATGSVGTPDKGTNLETAFAVGLDSNGAQSPASMARNITGALRRSNTLNKSSGDEPPPSPERTSHTSHIRKAIAAVRLNAAAAAVGTPHRRSLTGSGSGKWTPDSPGAAQEHASQASPSMRSRSRIASDTGDAADSGRLSPRCPLPRVPVAPSAPRQDVLSPSSAAPPSFAIRRLSVSLREAAEVDSLVLQQDSAEQLFGHQRSSAPPVSAAGARAASSSCTPNRTSNAAAGGSSGSGACSTPVSQALPVLAWSRVQTHSESGVVPPPPGRQLLPSSVLQTFSSRCSSQPGTGSEAAPMFGKKRMMTDLDQELAAWVSGSSADTVRRTWNGCSSPETRLSPSIQQQGSITRSAEIVEGRAVLGRPGSEAQGVAHQVASFGKRTLDEFGAEPPELHLSPAPALYTTRVNGSARAAPPSDSQQSRG